MTRCDPAATTPATTHVVCCINWPIQAAVGSGNNSVCHRWSAVGKPAVDKLTEENAGLINC